MKKTVFSQMIEDEVLYTIQDNGKSMLNDERKSISFVIDENGKCLLCELGRARYNGDTTEYDVIIKETRGVVSKLEEQNNIFEYYKEKILPKKNLPFIIYTTVEGKEEFRIPYYMEEILELKQNDTLKNCYYIFGESTLLPCKVDVQMQENIKKMKILVQDTVIFQMEKTWYEYANLLNWNKQENIKKDSTGEESEQDEKIEAEYVEVDTVATYIPARVEEVEVITSGSSEPIGKSIVSGAGFEEEKQHLAKIVKKLEEKIQEIQSKERFTSKYAIVRGGDDGTEFMQLRGGKEESEQDRKRIDDLGEYQACPYRYRVDVEENGKVVTYYLGPKTISNIGESNNILSYFSDYGKRLITYNSSDDDINQRLQLRRDLTIKNSVLEKYRNIMIRGTEKDDLSNVFRTQLTDPYLIQVLNMRRKSHNITDIILTIQKQQNKIVDAPMDQNMIIQGCAGSGKTMVMMHRLSRLQNWVQAFDAKEVLILTPSNQYEFYMKAVTEGLAIQNIQQSTLEQYYLELLAEYDKEFDIKRTIVSDFKADRRFVEYIYSDEFLVNLYDKYHELLSYREKYFSKLLELQKVVGSRLNVSYPNTEKEVPQIYSQLIENIIQKITEEEEKISKEKEYLNALERRKKELEEHLIEDSRKKLTDMFKHAWESTCKIILEEIEEVEDEQREYLLELVDTKISEISQSDMLLLLYRAQRIIPEIGKKIELCENAEKEVTEYVKEYKDKKEKIENKKEKIKVLEEGRISEKIREDVRFANDEIKSFSHYKMFKKAYTEAIKDKLQELGIKNPIGTHRYDLYAMLRFCRWYFRKDVGVHSFICVDEGQDLAINEYRLLKDENGANVKFNIYGDVKQLIFSERGINDWNELENALASPKRYILNENYRNTNQITKYCNAEFNMDVKQVGVDGPEIKKITFDELREGISNIKEIHDERWAILIPRKVKKKEFMKSIDENESSSLISDTKVGQNHIAIMYVDEIKGFEFDKVYYFGTCMNKNEQYIAATRALTELIFVSDEQKVTHRNNLKSRNFANQGNKMMAIKGDITKINYVDAIVNTTNTRLLGGGGVDEAIHEAAGAQLLEECRKLNGCERGKAKITKAYNLACKNIIHTVGPRWYGGSCGEDKILEECYYNSLKLAVENNIRTIAFPAIATGTYSYPVQQATKIAVRTVDKFLKENGGKIDLVVWVLFDEKTREIYQKEIEEVES